MKRTLFIYSGEGTRNSKTGARLLKYSKLWPRIESFLSSSLKIDLELIWSQEAGSHRCPYSPLLTFISQVCLSDIWKSWGFKPDVVVGHSTGELAAAFEAGFYSLEDLLLLAYQIGEVTACLKGQMIHGSLSDEEIDELKLNISSYNFVIEDRKHVTISGFHDEIEYFLEKNQDFTRMKLPHPWHHPDYSSYSILLGTFKSKETKDGFFVSSLTTKFETNLQDSYWRRWLVIPADLIRSIKTINDRYGDDHLEIIEIGSHPVLKKCFEKFEDYSYVSSMARNEDDINWIIHQRRKLDQRNLKRNIRDAVSLYSHNIDFSTPLLDQGIDSIDVEKIAELIEPFFPTLLPQDIFRYRTISELYEKFGHYQDISDSYSVSSRSHDVVISGMSCRLPAAVETISQFWEMLLSNSDQVHSQNGRGSSEAGYLNSEISRFDHEYFDISLAEAGTMDPQQILALELTEMLWRDAEIDPKLLDKSRVGVYLGVWNQNYYGDRTSVYAPTGTNPSLIASRISYHYDLRGPSWVSNTACSSSLVAVHYAAKDIEAGRVDYAIAGGVNMLLDERFSNSMRNSGFLAQDDRCKTFDDSANGYVRAEGGGLVLLVRKSLVKQYYAELSGSSINQNGGRSQVITAPHPEAQEELIRAACHDANINPREIAYVECHGTGTKLGDPIEVSALQNTVGKDRVTPCYLGALKSNIGHLESAAGIAGLIKAVVSLNYRAIPPNLHFKTPNKYIDFESYPIEVVTKQTVLDPEAYCGVSSFGFGGSNAHVIIKGAEAAKRKPIQERDVPFNRQRSAPLAGYLRIEGASSIPGKLFVQSEDINEEKRTTDDLSMVTRDDVEKFVNQLFFQLTSIQEIHPEIELSEQGLDSLSGTELISKLEKLLSIQIEPDIIFEYPLRDQFIDEVYALTKSTGNESRIN